MLFPARAAASAGAPLALSHRDRAACRRSYGRRASVVAASSGPSAARRAACQARPPVRHGAMITQVTAQHANQNRRDGDDTDGTVGPVLEAACFMWPAGAGPGGASARAGGGEDDLPAAVHREDEVVAAQGDGFLRAQHRVVQAAEDRGKLRPDAHDLGHDRPDLRRARDRGRIDGDGGLRRVPLRLSDGVGGQQPEFDGVAERAAPRSAASTG